MNTLDNEDNIEKLAPSSIKQDETVSNVIKTTDKNLSKLHQHLNDAVFLYRLDELSGEQLNHLASQWHVMVWRDSWSDTIKRNVLRSTIQSLRRLGTKSAIINVLSGLKGRAELTEWFEMSPQGTPHTFNIDVYQEEGFISKETFSDLVAMIDQSKPVRSQYTFKAIQKIGATESLSAHSSQMVYTHLYSPPERWEYFDASKNYVGAMSQMTYVHLRTPNDYHCDMKDETVVAPTHITTMSYAKLST